MKIYAKPCPSLFLPRAPPQEPSVKSFADEGKHMSGVSLALATSRVSIAANISPFSLMLTRLNINPQIHATEALAFGR